MPPPSEVQWVELRDLKSTDAARYRSLFDAFAVLYRAEFTNASEREDPDVWHARLGQAPALEPRMYITLVCAAESSRVLGGIAYEYYGHSRCALITYLVVDPDARQHGYGARLLAAARERLRVDSAADASLRGIFAEAEIPDRLADPGQRGPARQRLAILAALGARKVAIEYIQPELQAGNVRARHLMLLQLESAPLAAGDLRTFLAEFYRSLGIADPPSDPDFQASMQALRDPVATLRLEAPALKLPAASLSLHYIVEDRGASAAVDPMQIEVCPIVGSMERDLLSLSYQDNPEFVTYCHSAEEHGDPRTDYAEVIEVVFPEVTTFHSEGRTDQRYCGCARRTLRAYLSQTVFFDAQLSIWHVTLRPAHGEWFDEYDLIKLIQLYDGRTEGAEVHRHIVFERDGEPIGGVEALLGHLAQRWKCELQSTRRPVAGTIQLLDASIARGEEPPELFGADWLRPTTEAERARRDDEIRRHVAQRSAAGRRLLALCGIITGIFDFEQIDGGEALDTLAPTHTAHGALTRIDRRTLLRISSEDRSLSTVLNTLGISPYLIIPHALLIFDDHLAHEAHRASRRLLSAPSATFDALQTTREAMNRNLRGLWLSNVFNYATERALFSAGQEIRGTNDRYGSLLSRLTEIEGDLRQEWERRAQRNQATISLILAIVSIVTFKGPLRSVMEWLAAPQQNQVSVEGLCEIAVLVLLILVAATAYVPGILGLRARKPRSIRDRA